MGRQAEGYRAPADRCGQAARRAAAECDRSQAMICHPERSEGPVWEGGAKYAKGTPRPHRFLATLGMTLFAVSLYATNSATPPQLPGKVAFDQKLDAQVPLDLMFRDE